MAVVVLDDRDPAIVYSPALAWTAEGNPQAEYQGTVMLGVPDANMSATLNFIGTGVTVVGTIGFHTVQMSSYSVDGGTPTVFTSPNASGTWYSQTFFTTGASALASGVTHTLVVKPLQAHLYIDLIALDGAMLAPSAGPAGDQATLRVGPIVGGALGGLALVSLLFIMIRYLRRTKKMPMEKVYSNLESQRRDDNSRRNPDSLISPYDLSISSQNMRVVAGRKSNGFNSVPMGHQGSLEGCSTQAEPAESGGATLEVPQGTRTASPPPGYHLTGNVDI